MDSFDIGQLNVTVRTKTVNSPSELVVTTCKVDHETVVRIDRIPSDMIDYSKVAHAASGPYTGIYINKPTSEGNLISFFYPSATSLPHFE